MGGDPAPPDEKKPAEKVLTAAPLTLPVSITKEHRDQIAQAFDKDAPQHVRVALTGVKVPANWNPKWSIHVFVNNPGATAETDSDSPSFVTAFYFSVLDRELQNFQFNLTPSLARLRDDGKWKLGEDVQITFVVVPPGGVKPPADLKVPFVDIGLVAPSKP